MGESDAPFGFARPLGYKVFSDGLGVEEQVAAKHDGPEDGFLPVLRDSESTGEVLCREMAQDQLEKLALSRDK